MHSGPMYPNGPYGRFERGSWSCFERSAVVGNRCVYLLFQMHARLENNHSKLEKAFKGADERLTNVQLDRIKNGSCENNNKANTKEAECDNSEGSDGDESAGLCGVCQSEMHEEGGREEKVTLMFVCHVHTDFTGSVFVSGYMITLSVLFADSI